MKHILGYRCTLCGAELPYDERMTCPHCGEKGILDIVFDYGYIKKEFNRETLGRDRTNSMWRYAPLMPACATGFFALPARGLDAAVPIQPPWG